LGNVEIFLQYLQNAGVFTQQCLMKDAQFSMSAHGTVFTYSVCSQSYFLS